MEIFRLQHKQYEIRKYIDNYRIGDCCISYHELVYSRRELYLFGLRKKLKDILSRFGQRYLVVLIIRKGLLLKFFTIWCREAEESK